MSGFACERGGESLVMTLVVCHSPRKQDGVRIIRIVGLAMQIELKTDKNGRPADEEQHEEVAELAREWHWRWW